MEEKTINIEQKSSIGSKTEQIGVQNNYNGLTEEQMIQISLAIAKHFSALKEEISQIVLSNLEEKIKKHVEQILNNVENELNLKMETYTYKINNVTDEHIENIVNTVIDSRTASDEEIDEALGKYFEKKMATLNGGNA